MRRSYAWAAVALAAGLAGCSSGGSDPSSSDQILNLAVASVSAEAAARDIEVMHGPGGPMGFGFHGPGNFDCTGGDRGGLVVTRTCVYKDANGTTQSAYDATTTASVSVHVTVTGTVDRGHFDGTVNDVRDFTATGLAGAETQQTWNGTGSGTSTHVRTNDGSSVQFEMTHQETETDVVIPVPRTDTGWPLSGTITKQVTVKITGGPEDGTTRTRNVTITFDGSQYATITVDGDTFTVDLAARGKPHHGRDHPHP